MERLKKDLEHIKVDGIDSGALFRRVCKYLTELVAYKDTGLEPEDVKEFKERLEHRFAFLLSKEWNMTPERLLEALWAERDGRLVLGVRAG